MRLRGGGPEGGGGMTEERTVWWEEGRVRMIDQTRLPEELVILELDSDEAVAEAIRSMRVRGAPAIGVAAALGLALAARAARSEPLEPFQRRLAEAAERLRGTRPTAVNLFWALDRLLSVAEEEREPRRAAERLEAEAREMVEEDIRINRALGRHGAGLLPAEGGVLTHCNTGSLATGGGRVRPEAARLRGRDPAAAAGNEADRVGAAAGRHSRDRDHGQHGRMGDATGSGPGRDRRGGPDRRQRRHGEQDRHLWARGPGPCARDPLLRGGADVDP